MQSLLLLQELEKGEYVAVGWRGGLINTLRMNGAALMTRVAGEVDVLVLSYFMAFNREAMHSKFGDLILVLSIIEMQILNTRCNYVIRQAGGRLLQMELTA
jgi:hypothetical protein